MNAPSTTEWHAEHQRFLGLLGVVEAQISTFHEGERPNYRLMLDIIDYLRRFPDQVHHRREDAAFGRLLARQPDLAPVINRLLQEHRVIAAAGEELNLLLDEALDGAMIPRQRLEATAATYLVYYRHHIDWEEQAVMVEAGRLLTADDWKIVSQAVPEKTDRLFGEDFDVQYRDLRHQMRQSGGQAA